MLSLATPLELFEKSRLWTGTGFHFLPSFHHHPSQHNYTTHTVTLTSTCYVHYTDTHPTCNVVCPSGAWFKNRLHSKPFVCLARNPKCIMVQRVSIGTYRHTFQWYNLFILTRLWGLNHGGITITSYTEEMQNTSASPEAGRWQSHYWT